MEVELDRVLWELSPIGDRRRREPPGGGRREGHREQRATKRPRSPHSSCGDAFDGCRRGSRLPASSTGSPPRIGMPSEPVQVPWPFVPWRVKCAEPVNGAGGRSVAVPASRFQLEDAGPQRHARPRGETFIPSRASQRAPKTLRWSARGPAARGRRPTTSSAWPSDATRPSPRTSPLRRSRTGCTGRRAARAAPWRRSPRARRTWYRRPRRASASMWTYSFSPVKAKVPSKLALPSASSAAAERPSRRPGV